MHTKPPLLFTARIARASRRAIGAVHAADLSLSGSDVVTRCGVHLPRRRAVILPEETAVSCWRCEKGMASAVTCVTEPGARHTELWRLARAAYRVMRVLRTGTK